MGDSSFEGRESFSVESGKKLVFLAGAFTIVRGRLTKQKFQEKINEKNNLCLSKFVTDVPRYKCCFYPSSGGGEEGYYPDAD